MTRALILCAAAALAAAPASAQLMGARELNVGIPVKGAPSPKPVADIYYLVGESGAKETYTLTVKGPASVTLFGPDGSEILTSTGNGMVKLEVVLPFTDVFTLAVARKNPLQPYTLARKTTVPTIVEAELALGVGYESRSGRSSQCWVIPGVKHRTVYRTGADEITLAADRTSMTFVSRGQKGTVGGDLSYMFDGQDIHRTMRSHGGQVSNSVFPFLLHYNPEKIGRYTGYLCKDSAK